MPDVVLHEVSYLFLRNLGYSSIKTLLKSLKEIHSHWIPITNTELDRMYDISASYTSAQLDLVDCCIMDQAERLNITRIATFDRRDFSIFRLHNCDYLELLP